MSKQCYELQNFILCPLIVGVIAMLKLHDIQEVLWTDDFIFCLDLNDGRRPVLRKRNERFKDAEHDRFGGESVMVWAGTSYDGST